MTLATTTLAWTLTVYAAYALLFHDALFDTEFDVQFGEGGGFFHAIFDFFVSGAEFIVDALQFITLTDLNGIYGPIGFGFFAITIALPWLVIWVKGAS